LEIKERDRKEAENTLTLVKSCLENKDYKGARNAIRSMSFHSEYRKPAIEMVSAYKPKTVMCEKCGNELEWIFVDYLINWKKRPCSTCDYNRVKAIIKEKCQEIMAKRGIPRRYLKAVLGDFSQGFKDQASSGSGIFLWGTPGTGKTHFMAAMMREAVLNAEPIKIFGDHAQFDEPFLATYPLYISVPELLLKLRRTFNNSSETDESEIIRAYSEVKVLYLDDLGVEKVSDWALQTIYLIIDRRYSEMLRTIVSSNLSLDQLAVRLDDRIASRIAGMCEVVHMKGKDRRLSNK
jgi:DNA replication protein DnaC